MRGISLALCKSWERDASSRQIANPKLKSELSTLGVEQECQVQDDGITSGLPAMKE